MPEGHAAAAVTHPNACRLCEVGEHEGTPFLMMELLHVRVLSNRESLHFDGKADIVTIGRELGRRRAARLERVTPD
jgi:hypothetical protein